MSERTDAQRPTHMHEVLAGWARRQPEREAVRYGDRAWTWSELLDRVGRAAGALRAEGLRPGARIAVLDLNHPTCLELTLACAQAGTANVVVNFRLSPPEIAYVINDSTAEVLFVGPEFADAVAAVRDELPGVRRVVRVGDPGTGHDEYEDWLATEPDRAVHPAAPDECFLQLYTSGTTGFPKGAMLTHRGLIAHAVDTQQTNDAGPDASMLVAMPLFHVGGSAYALCGVHAGARLVIARTPDPEALPALLESQAITHTFFVPALLAAMTRVEGIRERDWSALHTLCYGASPMPTPVLRECLDIFPNVFMQVYGMTELSGAVSMLDAADHADTEHPERLVSAGRAIPGCEIEIRDVETGAALPAGEQGEVWVRSEQLMSGYWGKPEDSERALAEGGWYRSGDAGHLDPEGYLFVTDRLKDMIISGGENVYPAEVERVLAEHPSVADVTVVGVPDDRWGEVPKAVVVAADGADVDEAELLAFCREQLASFKCPKSVDVVDELPRNATGKILKKEIRARYWEGRERRTV